MTDEKKSFEDRLQDVQEIITRIEEGKLPLEDSVKQFEAGMRTLASLNRRLTVLQDGKEQGLIVPGEQHEDL